MKSNKLQTPILFLIFNRPSTTQLVFDQIREARPAKLYIAADGARIDNPDDQEKCLAAKAIATNIDWDCEVKTLFRDENLGCGKGVSSAITWFFEHEKEGIILEDDCLPSPDFFTFCATLLDKYRNDNRIMQIGGNNLLAEKRRDVEFSYLFSNHNNIWGWATWKRAWDLYDYEMRRYPDVLRKRYLNNYFKSAYEADYFNWVFRRTYVHPHITWDYQWEFIRRINSGLTIVPGKNLVINIGFGEEATHTTGDGGASANLKLEALEFPLRHPIIVMPDLEADSQGFITHLTNPTSRLKTKLKQLLPEFIRKMIFEASFKRYLYSYNKQIESNQIAKKPGQKDLAIVKAIMDNNKMRFFSYANLPLTMWGFDALIMI